jgi:hypothetical protein
MALGIAVAIREGGLSVEEAANDLFSMDNYLALRKSRLGKELLEIFDWGMQLEDVAAIVPGPGALDESLQSIVGIARSVLAVPTVRTNAVRRKRRRERPSTASRAA